MECSCFSISLGSDPNRDVTGCEEMFPSTHQLHIFDPFYWLNSFQGYISLTKPPRLRDCGLPSESRQKVSKWKARQTASVLTFRRFQKCVKQFHGFPQVGLRVSGCSFCLYRALSVSGKYFFAAHLARQMLDKGRQKISFLPRRPRFSPCD